jgi:AcrR family transcriptional regulator
MRAIAPTEKLRDADRSRVAILDAAERLFAERGFDGASLSDIGAAAGLSRATPSYFFGSKEQLYRAVLERVFADRQAATLAALEPVRAWCEGDGDLGALRRALAAATEGYLGFLLDRPAFSRFIMWEELAGARRLRAATRSSDAMQRTFGALRAVADRRGLRAFAVEDAVLLFVTLTYAPAAHRTTMLAGVGRELDTAAGRSHHVELVADQMMRLVAG